MPKKIINISQLPLYLQKDIKAEVASLNLKSKRKVVANTEQQTNKKIDLYQFETELRKELEAITEHYKSEYGVRMVAARKIEEESLDGDYIGNITIELLIVMTRRLASRYKESFKEDVEEMIQTWADRTQPGVGHVSVDVRIRLL